MARGALCATSDFRIGTHPRPLRGGHRRVHAARGRPLPQHRLSDRRHHHERAGGLSRGHRDRDHRQDRRGGQHDQRHRRAAFGDDGGCVASHRHIRDRKGRRCRRPRGARPLEHGAARPAEGHRPAGRAEARSGGAADSVLRPPVEGSRAPRHHGAGGQAVTSFARVDRRGRTGAAARRPQAADQRRPRPHSPSCRGHYRRRCPARHRRPELGDARRTASTGPGAS